MAVVSMLLAIWAVCSTEYIPGTAPASDSMHHVHWVTLRCYLRLGSEYLIFTSGWLPLQLFPQCFGELTLSSR